MRIERVGVDTVRVIRDIPARTTTGASVSIDAEPVDYGRTKIQEEKRAIQAQIDFWSSSRNITNHLSNLQSKLDEIIAMELELNK